MSFLDQIGDDMISANTEVAEEAPATQPEPEPRAEPEPTPEPQPEPEQPPQGGHIPIQALLDEREKRQEAQRRADDLERQIAAQQQQAQPRPDLYDDPDAFAADIQRQQEEMRFQIRAEMSANFARQKPGGDEDLQAAIKWAGEVNSPTLHYEFRSSADPYGLLIQKYKSDQLLSKIGSDPDAYVRQRYAELTAGSQQTQQPAAQAVTQQQPASKPVVRSLAAQQGAGGGPTPVEAGFENVTFNLDRKR